MQLSAFVDGELPEAEAELLLRRMSQDAELRQQVAEYLAIGRAIRGDAQVPGLDKLRERVAGELGESLADDDLEIDVPADRRFNRPLVGFAVAASVALVAIVGLRQIAIDDVDPGATPVAESAEDAAFTTPAVEDIVDDLRRKHEAEGLDFGARLAEYELNDDMVEIPSAEEDSEEDDESADEASQDETPVE